MEPSPENTKIVIPLLLPELHHPNPLVRTETAITLGTIGAGSEEVRAALEAAQNDSDPLVQKSVIQALKTVTKSP